MRLYCAKPDTFLRLQSAHTMHLPIVPRCARPVTPRSCRASIYILRGTGIHTHTVSASPAESRATRSSRKSYFCFTHRACCAWILVANCTVCLPMNTIVACGRSALIIVNQKHKRVFRIFPITRPTRLARRAHTLPCFAWGGTFVLRVGITFERCIPNVIDVANGGERYMVSMCRRHKKRVRTRAHVPKIHARVTYTK